MLTFSFAHGLVVALIAVVLLGMADSMLLPILQAYVSEQSPPNLRGRSLVTIEYSWAISGIIMIPIVGWLITVDSWQTPFRLLAIASFLGVAVLWFFLPRDLPRRGEIGVAGRKDENHHRRPQRTGRHLDSAYRLYCARIIFHHLGRSYGDQLWPERQRNWPGCACVRCG